ncbi:MAG: hypothetical protein ACRD0V_09215 [Acidimicrobiales bacterium]
MPRPGGPTAATLWVATAVASVLLVAAAVAWFSVFAADPDGPRCPPGHVHQTWTWPGGHSELRCAHLPPDPSHDR